MELAKLENSKLVVRYLCRKVFTGRYVPSVSRFGRSGSLRVDAVPEFVYQRCGVVVAHRDESGKVHVGWSLCHKKDGVFRRKVALWLAKGRMDLLSKLDSDPNLVESRCNGVFTDKEFKLLTTVPNPFRYCLVSLLSEISRHFERISGKSPYTPWADKFLENAFVSSLERLGCECVGTTESASSVSLPGASEEGTAQ